MALKWKDVTSHSRDTPEADRKPHHWQVNAGGLVMSVMNHHRGYPGKWVLYCQDMYGSEPREMGVPDGATAEQAQAHAVWLALDFHRKVVKALESA